MTITQIRSHMQISDVANLARKIWMEYYTPIIGQEQVDYMLQTFQSEQAIRDQITHRHEYYIAACDGRDVGYLAILTNTDEDALMISKIYVDKTERGRGYGRKMLDFSQNLCRERQIPLLWLTVNKYNSHSIAWYTKMGFENTGSTVQDIGAGFVMDDYRMQKTIG